MGLLKVVDASCGENHSMILATMMGADNHLESKIFVWGANDRKQLGLDKDSEDIRVPL